MKNGSIKAILAASVVAASFGGVAIADDILAVSWAGDAYTIDSGTGGGTLLGATGFASMNGMSRDGSGRYLTSVRFTDQLVEVDPVTGAGSLAATLSMDMDLRGLAFDGSTLYAVNDIGFGNNDELYSIDSNTGTVTLIGATSHGGIQGLAYGPDGVLYGYDIGAGLLTISTVSGASSAVGAPGIGEIQTISFDSSGTLWGCRDNLYTIDTSTGAETLSSFGNGRYDDVRGMEFVGDGPSDCLTMTVDILVAGGNATWDVSGATPGEQVAVVYGHQDGSTVVNGFANYCATFAIKGVSASRLICKKNADGGGNVSCSKPIPGSAVGVRVLSQAAERGTCPEECMSNLDDQVVL